MFTRQVVLTMVERYKHMVEAMVLIKDPHDTQRRLFLVSVFPGALYLGSSALPTFRVTD